MGGRVDQDAGLPPTPLNPGCGLLGEGHLDSSAGLLIYDNHEAFPGPRDQTAVAPVHVCENVAGAGRRCRSDDVAGRPHSAEVRPNFGLRCLLIVQQDNVIIAAGECLRDAHSDCSRMQIGGVRHRSIIRLLRPIEPIY